MSAWNSYNYGEPQSSAASHHGPGKLPGLRVVIAGVLRRGRVEVIESAAELGDEFALLWLALGYPRVRVTCKT